LVDESLEVPKHESVDDLSADSVPITYVPARNTIFLSFATAVAETRGAHDVFIGVNAVDYSGYPDCRPEFIEAFEVMANLATREGVEGGRLRIRTPLIDLTKAEIIQLGLSLGVDYGATMSCYDPAADGGACGHCDACLLRARGFADASVNDPTRYSKSSTSDL
jgi:7-cyano-7-deazaguanine synthase